MQLLLFSLDGERIAVPVDVVVESVRAVAVTPLPKAPGVVEGVIDLRGAVVPVFDMRLRFRRASRAVSPADHFVIVHAGARLAALHVDQVLDLIEVDDAAVATLDGRVRAEHVAGVATLADGLALIHDVATFLTRAEAETLDAALDRTGERAPNVAR